MAPPVPFSSITIQQYPLDNFKLTETENRATVKILNTDFLPCPGNTGWSKSRFTVVYMEKNTIVNK